MHKYLIYPACGSLTLAGTLHFVIDGVSQYARGKRVPGPETTLYYGLNTAYAMGQLVFRLFGVVVARQALSVAGQWPAASLTLVATACWPSVNFIYMEYWEPKVVVSMSGVLAVATALTA